MSERKTFLLTFDFEDWHQLVYPPDRTSRLADRERCVRAAHLDASRPSGRARHPSDVFRRRCHRRASPGGARGRRREGARGWLSRIRPRARYEQTSDEFRRDVVRCVDVVERICGVTPVGIERRGARSPATRSGPTTSSAISASVRLEPLRLAAGPKPHPADPGAPLRDSGRRRHVVGVPTCRVPVGQGRSPPSAAAPTGASCRAPCCGGGCTTSAATRRSRFSTSTRTSSRRAPAHRPCSRGRRAGTNPERWRFVWQNTRRHLIEPRLREAAARVPARPFREVLAGGCR